MLIFLGDQTRCKPTTHSAHQPTYWWCHPCLQKYECLVQSVELPTWRPRDWAMVDAVKLRFLSLVQWNIFCSKLYFFTSFIIENSWGSDIRSATSIQNAFTLKMKVYEIINTEQQESFSLGNHILVFLEFWLTAWYFVLPFRKYIAPLASCVGACGAFSVDYEMVP